MRIWSLHPRYLDQKGIVACWRETLLAQKVLAGETKGYRNHPQLIRFRDQEAPLEAIGAYLTGLYQEACERGYSFDKSKILHPHTLISIPVTTGQMRYETEHLVAKIREREPQRLTKMDYTRPDPHPIFEVVEGTVEQWEKV